ncbi:prophage tail fiber N-terminal domain-containing protein [Edwardsiella tarda]|uniref:prophage tail fiber N-terminal domain-containing protein n=1 Tax=Edwardsiella tarda TaxID=636 RepID=UPI00351C4E63
MATTISGKLINGIGEPIKNCKITLKSISTSTAVIAHTTASQTPSAAGDYSMSVEPGKYKVTLCVDGFPPEYVGDIQVYKDSPNGTLNYFLGLPQDNDLRPDAIKHFEAMVDKVASQVAEVEKSKLAAEGSARAAAASADRASQITGLSTVTDAISMASVPLPDVWIPFNDSLQMLTGYGEEVKVGAVTVAKMVSFSRSTTATYIDKSGVLRSASINEPLFEMPGLLREGKSTNLWINQNISSLSTSNATEVQDITPYGTNGTCIKLTPVVGEYSYVRTVFSGLTGSHTISCFAKNADGSHDMPIVYCGFGGALGSKMAGVKIANGWWRLEFTMISPGGDTGFGWPPSIPSNVITTTPILLYGLQIENLSLASSYIPTNGTQVTRSEDLCYVENQCNIPMFGNDLTVAINSDCKVLTSKITPSIITIYDKSTEVGRVLRATIEQSGNISLIAGTYQEFRQDEISDNNLIVLCRRASESVVALNGKIKKSALTSEPKGYYITFQTGHIRNLRIWGHALTDEQIKVLK